AEVIMDHPGPGRAGQFIGGGAEQEDRVTGALEARLGPLRHVVAYAEHADHRGGQDRGLPGLVVEADVATGDRRAEGEAAVDQAADRLAELPHHRRLLRGAEVQAVADRDRPGTGD